MDLTTIPDWVWRDLAQVAQGALTRGVSIRDTVGKEFLQRIYNRWTSPLDYQGDVDLSDSAWEEAADRWADIGNHKSIGAGLNDDSIGTAAVQRGPNDNASRARLFEVYGDFGREKDRVQFQVSHGGGIVLFNRMRRACQRYLHDVGELSQVIVAWKILSERLALGTAHSCVIYLQASYRDPQVTRLLTSYVWPEIKDLAQSNFDALGMVKVANLPFWAMPMPTEAQERRILGQPSQRSAGALMLLVLGLAFQVSRGEQSMTVEAWATAAKRSAALIVETLYAEPGARVSPSTAAGGASANIPRPQPSRVLQDAIARRTAQASNRRPDLAILQRRTRNTEQS